MVSFNGINDYITVDGEVVTIRAGLDTTTIHDDIRTWTSDRIKIGSNFITAPTESILLKPRRRKTIKFD